MNMTFIRHQAMIIKMLIVSLISVLTLACQTILTPTSPASAVSAMQTVEVVVPEHHSLALAFVKPSDNYQTASDNFEVKLLAKGIGIIKITDQNGNVLWTYNKTTESEEILTAPIKLVGNPGRYILTASLTSSDASPSSVLAELTVTYIATNVIPPIVPPNTGAYVKVFGRAIGLNQVISLIIYVAIISGFVGTVVYFTKRRKADD